MYHHGTKDSVTVGEVDDLLCVKLHNWGDKDWLEDRLTEDFDVGEIWCREEKTADGKEVFYLIFPEKKDRMVIQKILDQIG